MLRLFLLASLAMVLVLANDSSADQLRIGVTYRPDDCDSKRKSKGGDRLKMHYTGTLLDGSKFDSSLDRGDPFTFTLGRGQVIKGWDRGLQGMCVGEKRRLKIPPHLGYGAQGAGAKIPPNSWLVFEVECLGIE